MRGCSVEECVTPNREAGPMLSALHAPIDYLTMSYETYRPCPDEAAAAADVQLRTSRATAAGGFVLRNERYAKRASSARGRPWHSERLRVPRARRTPSTRWRRGRRTHLRTRRSRPATTNKAYRMLSRCP